MVLGMVLGGVPAVFMFGSLGRDVNSHEVARPFAMFMPISVGVAAWVAYAASVKNWRNCFLRAFLASFAAWLPVPFLTMNILGLRWDLSWELKVELALVYILAFMATLTALLSGFIALVCVRLKRSHDKRSG